MNPLFWRIFHGDIFCKAKVKVPLFLLQWYTNNIHKIICWPNQKQPDVINILTNKLTVYQSPHLKTQNSKKSTTKTLSPLRQRQRLESDSFGCFRTSRSSLTIDMGIHQSLRFKDLPGKSWRTRRMTGRARQPVAAGSLLVDDHIYMTSGSLFLLHSCILCRVLFLV